MVEPDVLVEGVGAVALPVPPLELAYHSKFAPTAVKAVVAAPWQ